MELATIGIVQDLLINRTALQKCIKHYEFTSPQNDPLMASQHLHNPLAF